MLTTITSATVLGLQAWLVQVEVDTSHGLGSHTIVGLPDTAIKESKERIETALRNAGLVIPFFKRFTINLAPADLRKEGPAFDLPIALAMLANEGLIGQERLRKTLIVGELSLQGGIRPVRGVLPMALEARGSGISEFIVPEENAEEASVVSELKVIPVRHIVEAVEYLSGKTEIEAYRPQPVIMEKSLTGDFAEVKGQYLAKRALEIAAAGGHNVLLVGSPGCGKTMLAKRFPSILPELSYEESIEVSKIYSIAGLLRKGLIRQRQFRSPHHTISDVGIVGGGRIPKPGEISLAHRGVLFMDEFPEFSREVLEVLRQPLENGEVTITRAMISLTYPAKFILIAAMNPCPCGYAMDPKKQCTCTKQQVHNYWKRLSGPILDRIDLIVDVPSLLSEELSAKAPGEPSQTLCERVELARSLQRRRYIERPDVLTNAGLQPRDMKIYCELDMEAQGLLVQAAERLGLSARAYDRVLKVSRTIADLSGEQILTTAHVAEALQYRRVCHE